MAYVYNSQLASLCEHDAFSLYHKIQESSEPPTSILGGPALPALGHALAGAAGSAISNLAVFPLDLVITRLQVQRHLRKDAAVAHDDEYKSVQDAFRKIYTKEGGLSAFYKGIVQDTGKSVLDAFLFFLFYNFLRQRRLRSAKSGTKVLPVLEELNVGMIAGAMSKFLTTPMANIVTRKQTSTLVASRSSAEASTVEPSVRDIANQIYRERGISGFWSGYSASLVLTLNPSITFFLYEFFKRVTLPRSQREHPAAKAAFLPAAVSKSIASTITYPFSLAKARAQTTSGRSNKADGEVADNTKDPIHNHSARLMLAFQKTPFATILEIARTEGIGALYEGLAGEVFKGFFSHGITMIVKETVHRMIIKTYYLILKVLRRYPSPQELALQIREQAEDTASTIGEKSQQATGAVREQSSHLVEQGREMLQSGKGSADEMLEQGKTQGDGVIASGRDAAMQALTSGREQISTLFGQTKHELEKGTNESAGASSEFLRQRVEAANEMFDITADYVGEFSDEISEAFRAGIGEGEEK
ncbi:MAG: hypothetical protein M1833_007236 [Piccolia ochrophora]|nr:MAG: hypothetical protein M1833_007236 [Piccolia ochrophora]